MRRRLAGAAAGTRTIQIAMLACAILVSVFVMPDATRAEHSSCTVARVIDGDTFVCDGGERVRLLQIDTPEIDACGGAWARAGLEHIFLRPGTPVRLEYDEVTMDRFGRHLAAPIVRGTDGADYNISIVMVYVGLAKAAYYGDNAGLLEWARASETWARSAGWNMWAPGGPFNGGLDCGG